jgi:hypothetical protein
LLHPFYKLLAIVYLFGTVNSIAKLFAFGGCGMFPNFHPANINISNTFEVKANAYPNGELHHCGMNKISYA